MPKPKERPADKAAKKAAPAAKPKSAAASKPLPSKKLVQAKPAKKAAPAAKKPAPAKTKEAVKSKSAPSKQTEKINKPAAPAAKTAAPAAKAKPAAAAPRSAKAPAPVASKAPAAAKRQAPVAKAQPMAKAQAPVAKAQAPVAKAQAPVAKAQPVAKTAVKIEQPKDKVEQQKAPAAAPVKPKSVNGTTPVVVAKPAIEKVLKPAKIDAKYISVAPAAHHKVGKMPKQTEHTNGHANGHSAANGNLKCPFSVEELKQWRTLLMTRRAEISSDIGALEKDAMEAEDGHTTPLHAAERGSDADLQDVSLGLAGEEKNLLWQIDRAIRKIDVNSPLPFGLCEHTREAIPKQRLQLIPWTPLSIEGAMYLEENGLTVEDLLLDD